VIFLAEYFSENPSPGAEIDRKSLGKEVLHAFKFICFTTQRQGSGLQLRSSALTDIDGGKLAVWKSMKGGREFALPIPQRVISEIPPLQDTKGRNFVFKSFLKHETPVSRSATYGVVKKLNQNGLFERNDILYFSPHDMRRTLVEVLDDAGMPAGASAVL
ncbi:MAG: tyrosine-type recombinase/integrase, partial [Gimesia chilikensis]